MHKTDGCISFRFRPYILQTFSICNFVQNEIRFHFLNMFYSMFLKIC